MTQVLDASAVLCWLFDEPGSDRMEEILLSGEPLIIHAVNHVEVQYRLLRLNPSTQGTLLPRLLQAGAEIARDLDNGLLALAADLKANQAPTALGDTFAVALAARRGFRLLTTDRGELQKVADAGICEIEFLQ